MGQVRQSVHLDFDGDRDLLLNFFGGAAGPLGDDLDVIVGDVRIGFDRQVVKGDRAPDQQQQRQSDHHETAVEREIDEAFHGWPAVVGICNSIAPRCSAEPARC